MVKQIVDQWIYSSHLRLALDLNDSDFDWWLKIGDAFRVSLRSDAASLFFDCSIPATKFDLHHWDVKFGPKFHYLYLFHWFVAGAWKGDVCIGLP